MSPDYIYVYIYTHQSESAFGEHPVQLGSPHSLYTSMYCGMWCGDIRREQKDTKSKIQKDTKEGVKKKRSNETTPCAVELAGHRQCHHRG